MKERRDLVIHVVLTSTMQCQLQHRASATGSDCQWQMKIDGFSRHWPSLSGAPMRATLASCSFTAGHVIVLSGSWAVGLWRNSWLPVAQLWWHLSRARVDLVPQAGLYAPRPDTLESTSPPKKSDSDSDSESESESAESSDSDSESESESLAVTLAGSGSHCQWQ